jgi:hypothetical protein
MRRFAILIVLLWAAPSWATTYYVRTDGNNSNAGTSNTAGGAWRTVDYASDHVAAGDTVRVQAGAYTETPTPAVSGTSGSPITYVADGTVTVCGMDIASKNYLRFIGFTFDGDTGCTRRNRTVFASGTNTGLEFWGNTFTDGGDGLSSSSVADRLHNTIIIGNTFTHLNVPSIGSGASALSIIGTHNVIAYNDVSETYCDAFNVFGTYVRLLNNYVHAMIDDSSCHSDFMQFGSHDLGLQFNLYESNLQVGSGGGDEHTSIIQDYQPERCSGGLAANCGVVTENLWRRNVIHGIGSGSFSMAVATNHTMTNYRMLHNADVNISQAQSPGNGLGCCAFYSGVSGIWIRNNIEYEAWTPQLTSQTRMVYSANGESTATWDVDYNLSYDDAVSPTWGAIWTGQAHEVTDTDPLFVDYANDNFTLGASSPAKDAGGAVCTVSGSGTGSTFSVATGCGGWFRGSDAATLTQYGGALAVGDTITVGTDVVTVTSVSGDALTVAETFTWANGDAVYWGDDTTPDIGPYPYKAGGYALAITHAQVGSTVTVTPNDADLVRMVVCYEDGVPVTVDNASPFTCTVGTGTFAVRAFPRYASTTLWASPAGAPSSPTGVSVPASGTPTLEWTHDRANVTHFECAVDGGTPVSLGLPTPTSTTYTSPLSRCGTLSTGSHSVTVRACNGTSCVPAASLTVVKL